MNELIDPRPPSKRLYEQFYLNRTNLNHICLTHLFDSKRWTNEISTDELNDVIKTIPKKHKKNLNVSLVSENGALLIRLQYDNPYYKEQFKKYSSDMKTYHANIEIQKSLQREKKIAELEIELDNLKKQRNK